MAGKGRRWSFPFGIRHLFRCFSCSFSGSVLSFVAKKTTCENSRPWGRWGWKFGIGLALCLGGADDIPLFCVASGHWIMTDLNKNPKQSVFVGEVGGWVEASFPEPRKEVQKVIRISLLITWNGRATRQFDFTIASRMPRLRIRVNGQQRDITAPLAHEAPASEPLASALRAKASWWLMLALFQIESCLVTCKAEQVSLRGAFCFIDDQTKLLEEVQEL